MNKRKDDMKEEDKELLERVKVVEDFINLCEMINRECIEYNEFDLAKTYEMIHSPLVEFEEEC